MRASMPAKPRVGTASRWKRWIEADRVGCLRHASSRTVAAVARLRAPARIGVLCVPTSHLFPEPIPRHRTSNEIALGAIATDAVQEVQDLLRLDTFRA